LIQDRYFDGECILLKDAIEDSEQQTKLVQQMHFLYQTKAPGNNYTDQMGADPRHQTLIRTWIRHRIWFLLSAMLLCQIRRFVQLDESRFVPQRNFLSKGS
jgi:hypothetical protein